MEEWRKEWRELIAPFVQKTMGRSALAALQTGSLRDNLAEFESMLAAARDVLNIPAFTAWADESPRMMVRRLMLEEVNLALNEAGRAGR